jgi:AbrB family looped-hinge helix DNA binding protein
MNKIKITSKGQITIPIEIREKLELGEGMYLKGYIEKGNIVLKPLPGNAERQKLVSYAHDEAKSNIGILKIREMTKGFNLNLSKQVRDLREEESKGDE